jgi:haloacid dehalogenase superfamily, subfamily IA, variant 3 with third motif having DD or ED
MMGIMIKAIVFDYGNVISEPQDTTCYSRMSSLSGLPVPTLMTSFWKYRPEYDRGTIRGIEMYRRILADNGMHGDDAFLDGLASRLLEEDLGSWFHVSRQVTEWGLGLQKSGYTLGILSNMPFDFLERYAEEIELFAKADVPVFSCDVDLIKPERAIYETLISKLGCKPEEIAFFDDLEVNIAGARDAGIHAFLFTGLEQAKKDFQSLVAAASF